MSNQKVQKVLVQPINLIFRYLQNRARIAVWLTENTSMRIEGHIIGFDEYMNLVLDDAYEVISRSKDSAQPKQRTKAIGRILLKGENIVLIQAATGPPPASSSSSTADSGVAVPAAAAAAGDR